MSGRDGIPRGPIYLADNADHVAARLWRELVAEGALWTLSGFRHEPSEKDGGPPFWWWDWTLDTAQGCARSRYGKGDGHRWKPGRPGRPAERFRGVSPTRWDHHGRPTAWPRGTRVIQTEGYEATRLLPPAPWEVLRCLAEDAASCEGVDAEERLADMGYDPDTTPHTEWVRLLEGERKQRATVAKLAQAIGPQRWRDFVKAIGEAVQDYESAEPLTFSGEG